MLKARLHAKRKYSDDEKVLLTFSLQNQSSQAVSMLKWCTPLEGLRSECLKVWCNEVPVAYAGPLLKRGVPGTGSLLALSPGQTVEAQFDLTEAYTLASGSFRVKLATRIYLVPASMKPEELPVFWKQRKIPTQPLTARAVTFRRAEGAPPLGRPPGPRSLRAARALSVRPQIDMAASTPAMATPAPELATASGQAAEPDVSELSAEVQQTVHQAHDDAFALAQNAGAAVADNALFKEWFGGFTSAQAERVRQVYRSIVDLVGSETLTYEQDGVRCDDSTVAVTLPDEPYVWLCSLFWNQGSTGLDSQPGALVHEFSHLAAKTLDIAFGEDACHALAASSPQDAANNADNFQFFAEQAGDPG